MAAAGLLRRRELRLMAQIRIGISGWTYGGWRGVFYPADLPQKKELHFASRALNSIEINGSFYSLQRPSSYEKWFQETPADFLFSVKGNRFITHMKKLKEVETPLANFFASGLLRLEEKLGPILWQFPPQFAYSEERFETFFQLLPRDFEAAAKLGKNHDARLNGRVSLDVHANHPIRHAVEIRHPSFLCDSFIAQLRKHHITLVFADTAGKWPYAEDLTGGFIYIRLHGAEQLYTSGYTDAALDWWANRIGYWRKGTQPPDATLIAAKKGRATGHDLFVYFDNDAKVAAPFDAKRLSARLGPKH
jgi:uncharacterized protein YecE (DUF72 family)